MATVSRARVRATRPSRVVRGRICAAAIARSSSMSRTPPWTAATSWRRAGTRRRPCSW
ncbi:hypothetical protein ACFQZC_02090 [Streptacidiphilus monticola]